MFLHDLPTDARERNQPLGGFYHRWFCWQGEDMTTPLAQRDARWRWWGTSPWKLIKGAGKSHNPMPVSKFTFNELLAIESPWVMEGQWSTDKSESRPQYGEFQPPKK